MRTADQLIAGERVQLYCERARGAQKIVEAVYLGATGVLYLFGCGPWTLMLFAYDDGTLRDGQERVVEVRSEAQHVRIAERFRKAEKG